MSCHTAFMSRPHAAPDAAPRQSARATLAARAGAAIRLAWRAYWDRRACKVTVLLLAALDDRTLHDIGLAPSEIESAVYGGRDRCRCYDAAWLWR
jgi:uncharacterized protein YjiS (DUF1127 family)